MQSVEHFPHRIRHDPDVRIPIGDRITLSAAIWRPITAIEQPLAAILEYIPYRKRDGTAARDALNHPYFAGHGYACVRVDLRGSGESEGLLDDEYTAQEQDDALEVLAWLADQPWCNSNVGMIGISWGGFNGLQIAARRPPELKAVVSIAASVDRYADDIHYKGGCLLAENFGWATQMMSYMSRPPDPLLIGDRWQTIWLERLQSLPHLAETWFSHQQRDDYWRHGSVCEDYSRITAPVLIVGGLADGYMNAIPALLSHLQTEVKGILGPWVHLYPHLAVPGPRIGFLQECLLWFDHWLKGQPNGVEKQPALRAYRREFDIPSPSAQHRSGSWIAETIWPSPHISPQTLYLNPTGLEPTATEGDALICNSPEDVGIHAGEYFAWQGPDQPGDQRDEDSRSLIFDYPITDRPLDLLGRPELHLRLSANRPQAHIAVRLNEVSDDGTSVRVSYGVLNLSQRQQPDAPPQALTADDPVDICLPLDMTCHRFRPGNRLRISISNSYWPLIWPDPEPVTLKIIPGASSIRLPVRTQRDQPDPDWQPAVSAPPLALRDLRPTNRQRRIIHNLTDGRTIVDINYDNGKTQDPDHGLISSSIHRERCTIDPRDPNTARMECHWTQELQRDDWTVRTETRSTLHCDAEHFYLSAVIEAYIGDSKVHERQFHATVRRRFV